MPITALYYPSFVALVNEDQVENVELTLGNSFMFSHAEIVEQLLTLGRPKSTLLFGLPIIRGEVIC